MDNSFLDTLYNAIKPNTQLFRLDAIHLAIPLKTSKETKRRICEGDFVRVDNGELVNCEDNKPHTHMITELKGTINNSHFEISVINTKTLELSLIKL